MGKIGGQEELITVGFGVLFVYGDEGTFSRTATARKIPSAGRGRSTGEVMTSTNLYRVADAFRRGGVTVMPEGRYSNPICGLRQEGDPARCAGFVSSSENY